MELNDSILNSTKKLLGIVDTDTYFDTDLIIHINSVFTILNQMGVGPSKTFSISSKDNKWNEFITERDDYNSIKTYIYLKTRLIFDPPINSSVLEAYKQQISELEWRLNYQYENTKGGDQNG